MGSKRTLMLCIMMIGSIWNGLQACGDDLHQVSCRAIAILAGCGEMVLRDKLRPALSSSSVISQPVALVVSEVMSHWCATYARVGAFEMYRRATGFDCTRAVEGSYGHRKVFPKTFHALTSFVLSSSPCLEFPEDDCARRVRQLITCGEVGMEWLDRMWHREG